MSLRRCTGRTPACAGTQTGTLQMLPSKQRIIMIVLKAFENTPDSYMPVWVLSREACRITDLLHCFF